MDELIDGLQRAAHRDADARHEHPADQLPREGPRARGAHGQRDHRRLPRPPQPRVPARGHVRLLQRAAPHPRGADEAGAGPAAALPRAQQHRRRRRGDQAAGRRTRSSRTRACARTSAKISAIAAQARAGPAASSRARRRASRSPRSTRATRRSRRTRTSSPSSRSSAPTSCSATCPSDRHVQDLDAADRATCARSMAREQERLLAKQTVRTERAPHRAAAQRVLARGAAGRREGAQAGAAAPAEDHAEAAAPPARQAVHDREPPAGGRSEEVRLRPVLEEARGGARRRGHGRAEHGERQRRAARDRRRSSRRTACSCRCSSA